MIFEMRKKYFVFTQSFRSFKVAFVEMIFKLKLGAEIVSIGCNGRTRHF